MIVPFRNKIINIKNYHNQIYSFCTETTGKSILIFGGNGYLGQKIVTNAIENGVNVISVNRSGKPIDFIEPKTTNATVNWLKGDIFDSTTWSKELSNCCGVISCVGAFGSNEFMEKMNGDANIKAISESLKAGVPRFVFVSTVENNLPDFVLKGYFNGKRRAEQALVDAFGKNGFVLRPGFIYGTRSVPINNNTNTVKIPLSILGKPLETILSVSIFQQLRNTIPGMKAILAIPLPVESVAKTAFKCSIGLVDNNNNSILTIEDIQRESK